MEAKPKRQSCGVIKVGQQIQGSRSGAVEIRQQSDRSGAMVADPRRRINRAAEAETQKRDSECSDG